MSALISLSINLLISLTPMIAIFSFIISKSSQLVILSMGGSFFWVIGILLYSIVYVLVTPLQGLDALTLAICVVIIEGFRYLMWFIYDKVYNHGALGSDFVRPTDFQVSISVGWSFAVTQAMIFHIASVFDSYGPGFIGYPACPSLSLFYIQSVATLASTLFQTLLGIIAFDAYKKKSVVLIIGVAVCHLLFSFSSLINKFMSCFFPLLAQYVILILTAIYSWHIIKASKGSYVSVNTQ
eukprot:TRINITY_DN11203_c0_g1_i1.p1 TRINITY_DN11203_c0_g1~~TRINITY_DN11203_c0_g1_i1.p1  ORF type:complete len:239 (-),score=21.12 TRINITY_DN11203_c0_g1_i1:156-872(-)